MITGTTALTPNNLTSEKLHQIAEEISALTLYDHLSDKLIDLWSHELDNTKVYIMRPKSQHIVMYVPRVHLRKIFSDMLAAGCRVRLEPKVDTYG